MSQKCAVRLDSPGLPCVWHVYSFFLKSANAGDVSDVRMCPDADPDVVQELQDAVAARWVRGVVNEWL